MALLNNHLSIIDFLVCSFNRFELGNTDLLFHWLSYTLISLQHFGEHTKTRKRAIKRAFLGLTIFICVQVHRI